MKHVLAVVAEVGKVARVERGAEMQGAGEPLFLANLDADLPPHLLQALISLFADPASNKRGAQLLFTSRNLALADFAPRP